MNVARRTGANMFTDYTQSWYHALVGLLFLTIIGAFIHQLLFHDPPIEPWGQYTTPAYVGTVDTPTSTVSRLIGPAGFPLVTSPDLDMVAVRCGPPDPIEVTSTRFWFIEGEGVVRRVTGATVPFRFNPTDPISPAGCGIVTFSSITIPDGVVEQAAGRLVSFRLDIAASNGQYLPVVLNSEQFRYDPDSEGTGVSRSIIPLEVP